MSSAEYEGMADLVERAIQVCDHVGAGTAREEFETVSREIRAVLRGPCLDAGTAGELTALLSRLAGAEASSLRQAGRQWSRDLADIYEQLELLRHHHSADELLDAAPQAALACCEVDRVYVSRVQGGSWTVQAVAGATGTVELLHRLRDAVLPLGDDVERTVVRSRRAAAVRSEDPGANKVFVTATASVGYAVAPVVSAQRTMALVHADRVASPRLDANRLGLLEAFAQGLGFHLDSIRLRRTFTQQQAQLEASLAAPIACDGSLSLLPADACIQPAPLSALSHVDGPTRAAMVLSPRELEVMELMARGQRNSQIAERLVLSEATIKSHVTTIMRKLHVSNRAEAVARYLSLSTMSRPS